jgi:hypothetical protein
MMVHNYKGRFSMEASSMDAKACSSGVPFTNSAGIC